MDGLLDWLASYWHYVVMAAAVVVVDLCWYARYRRERSRRAEPG
jgi:hypothetical protein